MRRVIGLFAFLVVMSGLLVAPGTVSAHADYERSEPSKNEVVPEAPERLEVWFTQELFKREGNNFLRVFDEQEQQVTEGDGTVDDDDRTHMYVELPPDLADGRYIVRWRTTSDEDGDQAEGAFCFYIGTEPTDEQTAECAAFEEEEEPTEAMTAQPTSPADATPATTDDAPTEAPASPTPADGTEAEDDDGAPMAAILGGALGGAAVLAVVIVGVTVWLRRSLR